MTLEKNWEGYICDLCGRSGLAQVKHCSTCGADICVLRRCRNLHDDRCSLEDPNRGIYATTDRNRNA